MLTQGSLRDGEGVLCRERRVQQLANLMSIFSGKNQDCSITLLKGQNRYKCT
jgi:hypothetical protein